MQRQPHPDRPQMPTRLPMKGDGTLALWDAWRTACARCRHFDPKLGCGRSGIVIYENGGHAGLPTFPGGCLDWSPA